MLELASHDADAIDITATGLLLGIVLGALVFAFLEWIGAPRLVAGLAGAAVFLLLALT